MDLVLDTQIRDFVLIPLVFIMFLVSLIRYYISVWMGSTGKSNFIKFVTAY